MQKTVLTITLIFVEQFKLTLRILNTKLEKPFIWDREHSELSVSLPWALALVVGRPQAI